MTRVLATAGAGAGERLALTPAGTRAVSAFGVWVWLSAIVLGATALRLLSFHGYWGTDDGEYARLASAMANGTYWTFVDAQYVQAFTGPAHLPYRLGFIAPLAALFRVFGVSESTLVAYPLAISLLGVLLAFVAARYFFGSTAGLIAAALWAVTPIDVDYATSFLPDGVASFYASFAVLAVIAAAQSENLGRQKLFGAGVGAGLLFGVSWLTKESVTYLVPFCGILIALGVRQHLERTAALWLGVAVGAGGILAAEMAYYGLAHGDLLLRMHENERSFTQTKSYLFYEGSRFGWPVGGSRGLALIRRLFIEGPGVFFLDPKFLFLPLIGLLASARALYWKDSAFTIPALWMLTLVGMYNFASPTFESYTPLVLLHRYLMPIVLPAIILTAGLVMRLLEPDSSGMRTERRFWGMTAAAALLSVSVVVSFVEIRDLRRTQPMFETREAASIVGPNSTVYTDSLSAKALEFYWGFPTPLNIVNFEGMSADRIAPGSFVLVDRNRLAWLDVNVSMWLTGAHGYDEPGFTRTAPSSWKIRWRNTYATLYRVETTE